MPRIVVVKNPDGSHSSEVTITVEAAELNDGRPTLIPSMISGKQLSVDEAIHHAIRSGLRYPSFSSNAEASKFAMQRSETGAATTHGFLGKKVIMAHKTPLVRGEKLTPRGRAKLQSQIKKAKSIMSDTDNPKAARESARRIFARATTQLKKHPAPAGKKSQPSLGETIRGKVKKGVEGTFPSDESIGLKSKSNSTTSKQKALMTVAAAGKKKSEQ